MKVKKAIEAEFFFGASASVFEKSRILRKSMTKAETTLWQVIKRGQIFGLHFRRQHPINRFIADFYCHKARLVIEVDGEIHNTQDQMEYDECRNYFMNELGLLVLRFTNKQVMQDLENVECVIREQVGKLLTPDLS